MTHKKTEVAKKLKSLPDLLGAINAYYDCSTRLDIIYSFGQIPEDTEYRDSPYQRSDLVLHCAHRNVVTAIFHPLQI